MFVRPLSDSFKMAIYVYVNVYRQELNMSLAKTLFVIRAATTDKYFSFVSEKLLSKKQSFVKFNFGNTLIKKYTKDNNYNRIWLNIRFIIEWLLYKSLTDSSENIIHTYMQVNLWESITIHSIRVLFYIDNSIYIIFLIESNVCSVQYLKSKATTILFPQETWI